MVKQAYVLLSGGVDSTTCLAIAQEEFEEVHAVSVNYGQRHFKEMKYAKDTCLKYNISHYILDIKNIVPTTMLTSKEAEVPAISYDEIKGVSPTYVPYRNGLMLSALTSYVAGEYQKYLDAFDDDPTSSLPEMSEWAIYFGAHAEDAQNWAYPDCTPEFIGAMANAIFVGTYHQIRLHTPLMWLPKHEIIKWGYKLKVDYGMTWSCYKGEKLHCGICPTCRARKDAFRKTTILDPTEYAA